MRVRRLHIGEELVLDGTKRKFRYSYLADAAPRSVGTECCAGLRHFAIMARCIDLSLIGAVDVDDGYAIQFVHSCGYRRNTSLARLRTYRVLGRRFRKLAESETPPDVIVAAVPSLEWAVAAVDYGGAHGIPVVVDVRDLWPDVFLNALPTPVRPGGRFLLAPYYRMARRACTRATAITAVSPSYLEWGLQLAGRQVPRPRPDCPARI